LTPDIAELEAWLSSQCNVHFHCLGTTASSTVKAWKTQIFLAEFEPNPRYCYERQIAGTHSKRVICVWLSKSIRDSGWRACQPSKTEVSLFCRACMKCKSAHVSRV
jgi:hypothetical protein